MKKPKHLPMIGTKVKFVHPKIDTGLLGKFAGMIGSSPIVYLPESNKTSFLTPSGITGTWICSWGNIELIRGQLLFNFMKQ